MKRGGQLRRSQLNSFSAKRLGELEQLGVKFPTSTFMPRGAKTGVPRQVNRRADTGPKQSVRDLVRKRSGGLCEWPLCPEVAVDTHHRLGRKQGGRHGEARERINGAAWLLHACRFHHKRVTSPFGERLAEARLMGWLLREHEDASRIPVQTRHDGEPVWLLPDGKWLQFQEAIA